MNIAQLDTIIGQTSTHVTEKEREFLSSARAFLISRGKLSHAQQEWAESISEKYSPEKLAIAKMWSESWTDEHRSTAIKVARYYEANPPYFGSLVSSILADPKGFFLTEKAWNRLCENKYAKKIRKEYENPPRFQKGQCVQIRKTNKLKDANYNDETGLTTLSATVVRALADKTAFVMEVDALPIRRAAKGSRVYRILVVGSTGAMYAHESDLKKARRPKK